MSFNSYPFILYAFPYHNFVISAPFPSIIEQQIQIVQSSEIITQNQELDLGTKERFKIFSQKSKQMTVKQVKAKVRTQIKRRYTARRQNLAKQYGCLQQNCCGRFATKASLNMHIKVKHIIG